MPEVLGELGTWLFQRPFMFPQTPFTCMTQDEGKPRPTQEALKCQGQGTDSRTGSPHLNGSVTYGWVWLGNILDLFVIQFPHL